MRSHLEVHFDHLWDYYYPEIDLYPEAKIIPKRRYRFDYANYQAKVAVELNGQIWRKGGHNSGNGLLRDYEKLNLAILEGYVVFQLAPEMITEKWLSAIAQTIIRRLKQ